MSVQTLFDAVLALIHTSGLVGEQLHSVSPPKTRPRLRVPCLVAISRTKHQVQRRHASKQTNSASTVGSGILCPHPQVIPLCSDEPWCTRRMECESMTLSRVLVQWLVNVETQVKCGCDVPDSGAKYPTAYHSSLIDKPQLESGPAVLGLIPDDIRDTNCPIPIPVQSHEVKASLLNKGQQQAFTCTRNASLSKTQTPLYVLSLTMMPSNSWETWFPHQPQLTTLICRSPISRSHG